MSRQAVAAAAETPAPGFHGKLPSRGDFVSRRLPRSFIEPWDQWLQQAVAASRQQLGDGWLDSYLTSPIWRFALAEGLCGAQAMAGVLMPSVDSVGRYFPMTLATPVQGDANPLALAAAGADWFGAAEELALSCLDADFELDRFADRLAELGPLPPGETAAPAMALAAPDAVGGWRLAPAAFARLGSAAYPDLLAQALAPAAASLWWSAGSEAVDACLLLYRGLPPAAAYAWLLAGEPERA